MPMIKLIDIRIYNKCNDYCIKIQKQLNYVQFNNIKLNLTINDCFINDYIIKIILIIFYYLILF